MRARGWILALLVLTGCVGEGQEPQAPVVGGKGDVYGSDDRTETFEGTDAVRRLAEAGAMLTYAGMLDARTDAAGSVTGYRVSDLAETLRIRHRVCPDVRFASQPVPGFCSATLVAPDLILTAGHCLAGTGGTAETARCDDVRVVFDFAYERSGDDVRELDADDVYACARVETLRNENRPKNLDWALVRLDRPVRGRNPAPVLRGIPGVGSRVMQIAHPSGLPQKLSPGVVTDRASDFATHDGVGFAYTADLFGGASGGGVFSLAHGAVAGVPAAYSGQNYVPNAAGTCNVVGICGVNATCPTPPIASATATMLRYMEVEAAHLLPELRQVGTPEPTSGSCRFPCREHFYVEGECAHGWQCLGGCLTQNGCTAPVEDEPTPACDRPCVDYGYLEGQCFGGWSCEAGCLTASACGIVEEDPPVCAHYPCDAYGFTEGQCRSDWLCRDGCLSPSSCAVDEDRPPVCEHYTCEAYSFREGQCQGDWRCQDGCLTPATCS